MSSAQPLASTNYHRAGRDLPASGIRPTFAQLGTVEAMQPMLFGRHQHPHYEIIVCDRGDYRCALNDQQIALRPGEALVVKPGDWHQDDVDAGVRYLGLSFRLQARQDERSVSVFVADAPATAQRVALDRAVHWPILERIQRESSSNDPFAAHIQDALLTEFFWRIVRALPAEMVAAPFLRESDEHGFALTLRRLFQRHHREQLSIGDMARELGMSPSSLTQKCRAVLGVPPARAFLRYKLERAAGLLQQTEMPIGGIADFLGFENPFHFSRVFKKHYGRAPSQFR